MPYFPDRQGDVAKRRYLPGGAAVSQYTGCGCWLVDGKSTGVFVGILITCLIGLVVGVVAKFLMPGKDPGGWIVTVLLGIAGSWVGDYIGRAIGIAGGGGWIGSILGAMLLLFIYRLVARKI